MTKHQISNPIPMNKYIQDTIKNNLRFIEKDLTKPQKKALHEMVRGLFTAGEPILHHMVQSDEKTAKKQAEKYSHHLGNIDIQSQINKFALKKALKEVKKDTVIAYDISDIAKEAAEKIENISRVYDSSKKRVTNGFVIHGMGINHIPVRLMLHDSDKNTNNQTRREIIDEITPELEGKGIWVFDRGNDDKQFFKYLSQEVKVRFVCRLRENRQVVIKKTGEKIQVKNLRPGKYQIYLMNKYNTRVDEKNEYMLVIQNHLEEKEPIRLISNLKYEKYTKNRIVQIYLERWGIENIYKRIKNGFYLEKIRVQNFKKFMNLVLLIQLATVIATILYLNLQNRVTSWLTGVLLYYKQFIKRKSLSMNIDSFITFLKKSLKSLAVKKPPPLDQLNLFSRRQLEKLGSF